MKEINKVVFLNQLNRATLPKKLLNMKILKNNYLGKVALNKSKDLTYP